MAAEGIPEGAVDFADFLLSTLERGIAKLVDEEVGVDGGLERGRGEGSREALGVRIRLAVRV